MWKVLSNLFFISVHKRIIFFHDKIHIIVSCLFAFSRNFCIIREHMSYIRESFMLILKSCALYREVLRYLVKCSRFSQMDCIKTYVRKNNALNCKISRYIAIVLLLFAMVSRQVAKVTRLFAKVAHCFANFFFTT